MQDAIARCLYLHHNQSVNVTTEMFRKSWRKRNAIRNGITDAVCIILGLYEIISLGIVQSRGFTFQALSSFRPLLIKCKSQQFITVFYSFPLRSLLFKSAPEIVIWNFCFPQIQSSHLWFNLFLKELTWSILYTLILRKWERLQVLGLSSSLTWRRYNTFIKSNWGKTLLRGKDYLSKRTKLAQEQFRLEMYIRFTNIKRMRF